MEAGRRFHALAAAAGNERSPRVDRCVWAGRLATGCRLNAGDDGLRQRLFAAGFRRGMSELCHAGSEMPIHRVGTVSARGPATNAGRGEAE